MSEFGLYFELGIDHILDVNGYDHILFVIALCAIYILQDWKHVLILITAFTIGHSITLALATLRIVNFDSDLIEFLIPVTIFLTALSNLFKKERTIQSSKIQTNYLLALFFGLIHGLGFSNFLRSILGQEKSIVSPLLAFNIGLEVGQIIIVAVFLIISFILVDIFGVKRRDWRMVISSATAGIALMLIVETKFLN
ncbi:HupE/UreJ family protein [Fulvivirga kasyanovii]|uniref:HupE/UreJ family protein n=1 Tax=Fulvivirga kasyanovii TaxID=396812 RepID=A0ABW9RT90_9BACT|nr:HupE/UreJ family protein [Fulvivirga kasyanovii]MTI27404.1 HupE/UreJ family protein [Fulvivirga kasyanovii]